MAATIDPFSPGPAATRDAGGRSAGLRTLVGSGEKIGLVTLPVLVVGLALNLWRPSWFGVGGPPEPLRLLSWLVLLVGFANWAWSAVLIVTKVPKGELITTGPFAVVKHPLYTGVACLVMPWIGFLLNTWLGVVIGGALYGASRVFSPREEADLSKTFGSAWDEYRASVKIPWL